MVTYNEVIKNLQNMGEVNVKLAMHAMDVQESGEVLFRRNQPVCFLLDAEKPAKKAKKACDFPSCNHSILFQLMP